MTEFPTPEVALIIGGVFVLITLIACVSNGTISLEIDFKKGRFRITRKRGK